MAKRKRPSAAASQILEDGATPHIKLPRRQSSRTSTSKGAASNGIVDDKTGTSELPPSSVPSQPHPFSTSAAPQDKATTNAAPATDNAVETANAQAQVPNGRKNTTRKGPVKNENADGPSADQRTQSARGRKKKSPEQHVKVERAADNETPVKNMLEEAAPPAESAAKVEEVVGVRGDPEANDAPTEEDSDENVIKEALSRPPPVNSDYLPLPWKGRLGYVGNPVTFLIDDRLTSVPE